jgi:hypothetical protein
MATTTTNLGLTKPSGTDKIRIAQINGNMDILDDKIGAVGNTSLQAQVTSANEAIANKANVNTPTNDANTFADGITVVTSSSGISNLPTNDRYTVYSWTLLESPLRKVQFAQGLSAAYIRSYSGSWGNWQELALNSNKAGAGTNLSYVTSITFKRSAGMVHVKVDGLSSLPNGGWTTICNIPSDFIPVSGNINIDYIANANDQCSSIQLLRFRANVNGVLQVYNYGSELTYANFAASFIYPV